MAPAFSSFTAGSHATLRSHTMFFNDSVISTLYTFIGYEPVALAFILDLSIQYQSQLPFASPCLIPPPQSVLLPTLPFLSPNLVLDSHSSLTTSNDSTVLPTTCHVATKSLSISTLRVSTSTAMDRLLSQLRPRNLPQVLATITQAKQPSCVSFLKISFIFPRMPLQTKTHENQ